MVSQTTENELLNRLESLRRERKFSLRSLAHATGIGYDQLRVKFTHPWAFTPSQLQRIADAYGVEFNYLIGVGND